MCISDLQSEVSTMKQDESIVIEFFTKLHIIWDDIDNFRPNHVLPLALVRPSLFSRLPFLSFLCFGPSFLAWEGKEG